MPPHLDLLNRKLVDAAAGRVSRLLVTVPPRHGKSTLVSHYAPAWFLGTFPDKRVLLASYEADFAARWGRRARDVLEQYGPDLFGVSVRSDSKAADRWEIEGHDGGMETAGVGGPMTGKGADCLPEGTLIQTEQGHIDIANLVRLQYRGRVLAYNHREGRPEWRRVVATREVLADELIEVRTTGGRAIRATGEHCFYVPGRGYREAALLAPGDKLLVRPVPVQQDVRSLRGGETGPRRHVLGVLPTGPGCGCGLAVRDLRTGVRQTPLRIREGVPEDGGPEVLLRPALCPGLSRGQGCSPVSAVPETDARAEGTEVLFRRLPMAGPEGRGVPATQGMPGLRCRVHARLASDRLLLPGVSGPRAFGPDDGEQQLPLQGRGQLCPLVQPHAPSRLGAGRMGVRRVRRPRDVFRRGLEGAHRLPVGPGDSSHQRGSRGQLAGEPGDALQDLPRGPSQVECDTVAVVRRLRTPSVRVYDLQVEGNHNFFAGEVLVHNCLIIDDPVKNAEEAHSPTIRARAWEWFRSTAYTRLEPGGVIILVMTRWHESDLAGMVLGQDGPDAERWDVLNLPALAEPVDPLGRPEGAALWPDRFPVLELNRIRATLGLSWFSALYQGRPLPASGGLFRREWLPIVEAAPAVAERARYWDLAATTDGDWTVGVRMARARDGTFAVEDVVRGRWTPHERDTVIRQTAELDGTSVPIWVEEEGGSAGKSVSHALITRVLAGFPARAERPTGSKEVRAQPLAAQCEAGNVRLVRGRWDLAAFLDELATFPHGKHDDQVDAAAGAFNKLTIDDDGPLSF